MNFNPAAGLRDALHWDHRHPVSIYAMQGVDRVLVEAWSVAELLWGLLAECCHVLLGSIVAGRASGCAFPDIDHECEHDVFRDVFARWDRGELAPPEPGADPGESGRELQAQARKRWTVKELKRLKLRDLKSMALEDGWERADIAGVKKSVLIELMVEGQTLPPDV